MTCLGTGTVLRWQDHVPMAPCGPIVKLAWCYWGLAGDTGAGVRVRGEGEGSCPSPPASAPSRRVGAKEEAKDEGAEQEGGSRRFAGCL